MSLSIGANKPPIVTRFNEFINLSVTVGTTSQVVIPGFVRNPFHNGFSEQRITTLLIQNVSANTVGVTFGPYPNPMYTTSTTVDQTTPQGNIVVQQPTPNAATITGSGGSWVLTTGQSLILKDVCPQPPISMIASVAGSLVTIWYAIQQGVPFSGN